MDGVETLNELKTKFPVKEKETPIVCLTANVLSGAREQMLKVGFTDYLTKPINLNDIEQMLLKYIAEEKIHMKEPEEEVTKNLLPESLKKVKGLDTESGLEFCGDEGDYLDAIEIFCSSIKTKSSQMDEYLKNGDNEKLSLMLHSLKSTSKAIGAIELSGEAAELERRSGGAVGDNFDKDFEEKLREFISEYITIGEALDKAVKGVKER